MMSDKKGSSEKLLYCSFCGKSQHEVRKLIAGPSVFICDECIELCNDIIRDEAQGEQQAPGARAGLPGQFGGRAGLGEYLLGSRQEDSAGGSEFHHATIAIEELHTELALEQGDLLA